MGFEKNRRKTGGRKKGIQNKRTEEMRERIRKVMIALEKTLIADIKALKAAERTKLFADLIEYDIPKLTRTELTGEVKLKEPRKIKYPDE